MKIPKYLKESCCLASDLYFSFKYFFRICFCKLNISKIVRPVLAAMSANELKVLCIETSTSLGSLQKFEEAAGRFLL